MGIVESSAKIPLACRLRTVSTHLTFINFPVLNNISQARCQNLSYLGKKLHARHKSRITSSEFLELQQVRLKLPLIIVDGIETPRHSLLTRILNNKPFRAKWTQSKLSSHWYTECWLTEGDLEHISYHSALVAAPLVQLKVEDTSILPIKDEINEVIGSYRTDIWKAFLDVIMYSHDVSV